MALEDTIFKLEIQKGDFCLMQCLTVSFESSGLEMSLLFEILNSL